MTMGGATGAVLKRALASLTDLVNRSIAEVRSNVPGQRHILSVASLIADAETAGHMGALAGGCALAVPAVDPDLVIRANRGLLLAALANLLQNAFRFTHKGTEVTLKAHAFGEEVLIEVRDNCGGLPVGSAEKMFTPFSQRSEDKSGLGLGLSIARQSVEADAGTLSVRGSAGHRMCLHHFASAPLFAVSQAMRTAEYWRWRYRNLETGQICRTMFQMSEEEARAMYGDAERIAGSMTLRAVVEEAVERARDEKERVIKSRVNLSTSRADAPRGN